MADYHFVYKDVEGASTQWDDIHRKLGNFPPKPPPFKPPPFTPAQDHQPNGKASIDHKTQEELKDLEDDLDLDDHRFLQEYRYISTLARFGSVIPISGPDFVREVAESSSDVWVIVILYKYGYPDCELLLQCLEELARRYPATKFVKIISTECIQKYPDGHLPTLLVYKDGAPKLNYVGLHTFGGHPRCTPEGIALVLCQSHPVLNDGRRGGAEQSKRAVLNGVRRRFLEKVVAEHEDDEADGSSSD